MAGRPFLNIDAGETEDEPAELYALAHAVSVACGGHAGDRRSMERVVRACKAHGTRVGAHPSYEDREGFGRREIAVDPEELLQGVLRQLRALHEVASDASIAVDHVKPHGALYHVANRDERTALVLMVAARRMASGFARVIGPPGGALEITAMRMGLEFVREGFADRAMRPDGSLVPRGEAGAVIADPAAARAQARRLAATGSFETLCVHGDTRDAVAIARAVREELDALPAGE